MDPTALSDQLHGSEKWVLRWLSDIRNFFGDCSFNVLFLIIRLGFMCCTINFVVQSGSILKCYQSRPNKNVRMWYKSHYPKLTCWNKSLRSGTDFASFFMAHVAQMPASPGCMLRASAPDLRGMSQFFLPYRKRCQQNINTVYVNKNTKM